MTPEQARQLFKELQQKAKENNHTIEEMLEIDAQWVINRKIEKDELFQ
jgi:polyhydroxyalkanoate synthesis regulator phasin